MFTIAPPGVTQPARVFVPVGVSIFFLVDATRVDPEIWNATGPCQEAAPEDLAQTADGVWTVHGTECSLVGFRVLKVIELIVRPTME